MASGVRFLDYLILMRLHRPIGIFLLLWPALWGLWLASAGRPDPLILTVFVLGVVLMRSAGCVINDYADRAIDPQVARTRDRPLAAGRVTPRAALILFAGLSLSAFALVLLLNALTIALACVAALLAVTYPFLKRYTHLPQFYLGAAFGWSIPMAFAAHSGGVPAVAWLLFAATVLWAVAYDTEYAMVDRNDDRRIGVKSTAILFGAWDRGMIGLSHASALGLLAWAGVLAGRGGFYYAGLAAAALLATQQLWLIRARDRDACFRAFLHNNRYGALIFIGLVVDYL